MSRPLNFILLVGEDAGRALGCYRDPAARTLHLDRLAAEGARFDQAYSDAPFCAPSRCALVTGRQAWSLDAHHMRSQLTQPPPTFTAPLREALDAELQRTTELATQPDRSPQINQPHGRPKRTPKFVGSAFVLLRFVFAVQNPINKCPVFEWLARPLGLQFHCIAQATFHCTRSASSSPPTLTAHLYPPESEPPDWASI